MDLTNRIKLIQKELNVNADGIIGNDTITALENKLNLNNKNMKTVCLCIGHSAADEGARSIDNKIGEYSFNKNLANLIKEDLESNKINVAIVNRLTDGGGTGMSADIKAVNSIKSECIIELHANAFNNKATGSEVLYWHSSSSGKKLANYIQSQTVKILKLADRGIKPINNNDRGGSVLKGSKYPMVICEPFFIDNPSDLKIVQENEKELSIAISKGIQEYLYS